MERRRPNRELKNSEDVQGALIGDYFRYNDLSRMEADEIESPNYEYVELDLLNLPRDLSTNLNEDSDNQKENVVPNERFRMVSDEENCVSLEKNVNKNTKTKTKSDMKVITDFFTSIGEERAPEQIPPKTLTVLWLDSSWVYPKRMVLNMNTILWVPCTTALTDT
jgi:hypothetical protein